MAPGMSGRRGAALLCLSVLLAHAASRSHPASPSPPGTQASPILPVSYRLSHTRLAFFLKEARPLTPAAINGSLQRSEPFVVFQTKELPVLNVSLGPFSTSQVVARELLQPSSTLDIPERLTVNWKVRAFIVRARVPASQPVAQVLFYVAGRDWDDFGVTERLPCVRLHAFRDAREVRSSCRLGGALATCLVRAELPLAWFGPPAPAAPPSARRKSPDGLEPEAAAESQQVELYYTLHAPDASGGCGSARRGPGPGPGAAARAESPTQHPLLRIGSISLFRPPPRRAVQEHRLDSNLMIRLPDRPLRPGEVLSILLYLAPNSSSAASPSVEHFTLRVKAKKGVTLLGTKSRSGQWRVTSELLTGAKHSTATVDVAWALDTPLPPWEGQGPLEILQLDFEMENFTSQSVKRRIMWHIDYRGHSALPDLERAVTELTVIQRDVQAILPLAMDTEIINTAILTGRTVAIPVKVIAIEVTGLVLDVSDLVECQSHSEDIIKVSSSCDYVFVSGKESRGSMNARVTFRYDVLSAPLEMTVWVPKLPLHIELSDARLSQVKGWRVPILPDRRSARESEDEEEEEEERRQSANRGCTLQYQHATLQVFTQFHTTSSEGTDQVVTMLGPDWLVEVTDLVSDFMRVGDPRVAHLVDSNTLAGLEPGTTPFKVVSPLTEAVLGETLLTVTEEKVSITQLQAQVVASLTLSLRPSPGSSHTILATTAAQPTLSLVKQEALLSLWLSYSDGTTAPLSLYSSRDYGLLVSSLDERVATVTQDKAFPLVVAEAEGSGDLLRAELTISESCQKTKRKSVLATTPVSLRVHFGRDEEDPTYDYPGPSQPGPGGGEDEARGAGPPGTAIPAGEVPGLGTAGPVPPTEDYLPLPTGFLQMPRGLTDLEIGMYALLGVFCLAILVFLINCIVFVLRYRHKRIPPEGQTSMDHSHHWVFLGNGQPLRVQGELSPPAGSALETVPACCHGDHHSSGSSQTSVQSQVHGRGDGSSGGSARDQTEDPASSPTSKRKRVKFTTFTTLPTEELAYDSVPAGEEEDEEEDLGWGCPDVAGTTRPTPPPDLHNYMRRIKDIA
ncbi:transmembrane protein 132E precursor [Mus musculus]|uniref:Transmembrane protein 132E n=1 Tax=Mus musculus TaxID=10090 RepID=T132E_MOUSE|nr:transmembrane protein 132E precursor [Mus musculus]Q6IEE6.2 RecName: Full=Transmembrane protein 132E; Flags: Precursor [Mus musculus]|eukprot:NP_001291368.1 transmembrane protein 132E precursor [Mus musculus]